MQSQLDLGSLDRWQGVPFPLSAADYGGCRPPRAPFMRDDELPRGQADPWDQAVLPLATIDLSAVPVEAVPDRMWIVPNLIPDRNVTDLSGDGGLGKSLLALQLGIAMTTKSDWLGTLPAPGVVLYVSCEDDPDEIMRRRNAVLAGMGLSPKDLHGFYLLDMTNAETTELAGPGKGGKFELTALYEEIGSTIAGIRRKHQSGETRACAIIDTRADMFGGNELSRVEVRAFVRGLRRMCVKHDIAIILLSHPSASGMSSGSGQSGSTAWGNSVRSRLYLTAPPGEGDAEPDPDLRVLSNKKSNYGPRGSEITLRWKQGMFRPEGGSLSGMDKKTQDRAHDHRFLELLAAISDQNRRVNSSTGPNYAPTIFSGIEKAVTKRQFKAAMERLFASGEIIVEAFPNKGRPSSRIVLTELGARRVEVPF